MFPVSFHTRFRVGEGLTAAALGGKDSQKIFEEIARLKTGECLIFCSTAAISIDKKSHKVEKINTEYVTFSTRKCITTDGGRSELADRN